MSENERHRGLRETVSELRRYTERASLKTHLDGGCGCAGRLHRLLGRVSELACGGRRWRSTSTANAVSSTWKVALGSSSRDAKHLDQEERYKEGKKRDRRAGSGAGQRWSKDEGRRRQEARARERLGREVYMYGVLESRNEVGRTRATLRGAQERGRSE